MTIWFAFINSNFGFFIRISLTVFNVNDNTGTREEVDQSFIPYLTVKQALSYFSEVVETCDEEFILTEISNHLIFKFNIQIYL